MKNHVMLTVASLLSILLLTLHLADDIVRGMAPGGPLNMIGLAVLAGWVCATLVLAGRRSGNVINLVLSLIAAGNLDISIKQMGIGRRTTTGAFLLIQTQLP